MNKEVEILKIGRILPFLGNRLHDTSQFISKQTIMVVHNDVKLFDYYVSLLKNECGDKYNYLKSEQSIIGYPTVFKNPIRSNHPTYGLKGISDGDPIIGKPYTINNSNWHTSTVERIIDDCVIITENSVYAIHNISDIRNKKIKDLGL